uniref:Protein LTV1 homolog n=1 Tax=Megaselia scalaris TaxID=36166 RepID=T1H1I0_MEGSC
MSPLQSTLGISGNTRSPIQAPEWKANAAPSTLPSVPMLLDDDDDALMSFPPQNVFAANQRQSSQSPGSNHRHKSQKKQQKQQQPQTQQQNNTFSNNFSNHSNNSSIFGGGSQQQQQQQLPLHQQPLQQPMPQQLSQTVGSRDYSQPPINGSNGAGFSGPTSGHNLDQDIGILSSSSSSGSDSESSSDSDSSDSDSDSGEKGANSSMTTNHQRSAMPTVPLQSMPLVGGFGSSNGGELLQNDLQRNGRHFLNHRNKKLTGKGKKAFIDKKNAVTFHLVHRSQRDPLAADDSAPQHIFRKNNIKFNSPQNEQQKLLNSFMASQLYNQQSRCIWDRGVFEPSLKEAGGMMLGTLYRMQLFCTEYQLSTNFSKECFAFGHLLV